MTESFDDLCARVWTEWKNVPYVVKEDVIETSIREVTLFFFGATGSVGTTILSWVHHIFLPYGIMI